MNTYGNKVLVKIGEPAETVVGTVVLDLRTVVDVVFDYEGEVHKYRFFKESGALKGADAGAKLAIEFTEGEPMAEKLSPAQQLALLKSTSRWQSAYDIKVSLATLEALKKKGLLDEKVTLGYMAFPRNAIYYKLTGKGLALKTRMTTEAEAKEELNG